MTPQRIDGLTILPPVSLPIETDQPCGGRGAGTCARSGCSFFKQPRIHGLPPEPDVVERKCSQTQLGDEYGAGRVPRIASAPFDINSFIRGAPALIAAYINAVAP